MKKDKGQIAQEEEGIEGKPQVHILSMKAKTDMLVHTQAHTQTVYLPTDTESGDLSYLSCSFTLHAVSV